MFLDCVVGQMDNKVIKLVKIVLLARHANVALLKVEAFVVGGDHHPETDIELPLIDKQRPLYILLEHENITLDTRLIHRRLLVALCRGRLVA